MRDHKNNQDEPANEEDRRGNEVRPKMVYPPAGDRWNGKNEGNDEDALALRDGKDGRKEDQRKQKRQN